MVSVSSDLLSICIPTYNRADLLKSCLLSIFSQLKDNHNIEVVVSNNKSTDHTYDIIAQYLEHPAFKYFEQETNIGFTHNVLSTVRYAKGEYCWIIGDDDFILDGALEKVVRLIKDHSKDTDYFYASVKSFHMDEYNKCRQPFDTTKSGEIFIVKELSYRKIEKFEELISPEYSIIFLGELMASIFRRKIWLEFDSSKGFNGEFLDTLETSYPHSVILANKFFGRRAIYIETPLILSLEGAREWWDKIGYVMIEQVRNLLDLYESKGIPRPVLNLCHRTYIYLTFKHFVKFLISRKSKYKNKVSFSRYTLFLLRHPVQAIQCLGSEIKSYIKSSLK